MTMPATADSSVNASIRADRIARLRDVTTPDESISAQAGLANEPILGDETSAGPYGIDDAVGETDTESALPPDGATRGLADHLPDEPSDVHVAAYAAAADELAQRLEDSGTGRDDSSP
jgi:hypothetical protein